MSSQSKSSTAEVARPGKREATKASNRQAILDAGRNVFAELGFGAASVRDIIRRTGLASGTFYNYFKSKEEVFEALMDESALVVRPRLHEVRERARNLEDLIQGTFSVFFYFCCEDKSTYDMMRRMAGDLRFRLKSAEVLAGFEELRADLVGAVERGLLPPVDVDYLAASFYGIGFEIADRMVLREPVDVDGATRFATGLFLGGIGALPSRS